MVVIKIFGLPRSCTNITEALLNTNFNNRVLTNFPCWKHGENTVHWRYANLNGDLNICQGTSLHTWDEDGKRVDTDDLRFVICTKSPIPWLWSLYKFENETKWNIPRSQEEFLQGDAWHYRYDHRNIIDVHNQLIKHWFSMAKKKHVFQVKHEDITSHPIKCLSALEKKFSLSRRQQKQRLKAIRTVVGPGVKQIKQRYRPRTVEFTHESLAYIESHIDKNAVRVAGY